MAAGPGTLRAAFASTAMLVAACGIGVLGSETTDILPSDGGDGSVGGDVQRPPGDDGAPGDDAIAAEDVTLLLDAGFDVVADVTEAGSDGACLGATFRCGGGCVDTCLGCAGAPFECTSTRSCLSGCQGCADKFECMTCAAGDLAVTDAGCTKDDKSCYAGTQHCAGCRSVGCPGGEQLCVHVKGTDYECFGCGEPGTDKQTCANGAKCSAPSASCP